VAADLGTDPEVAGRLRAEYQTHLLIARAGSGGDTSALCLGQQYTALRLALPARKLRRTPHR